MNNGIIVNVFMAMDKGGSSKAKPVRPDFDKLDSFTKQYIGTALWAENDESTPEGGEPFDKNYDHTDISDETLIEMVEDCRTFQEQNRADLDEAASLYKVTDGTDGYSYAGHDFWLTRCGHGTGFWDRNELDENGLGERLTKACKMFGSINLYLGDDGKIYIL